MNRCYLCSFLFLLSTLFSTYHPLFAQKTFIDTFENVIFKDSTYNQMDLKSLFINFEPGLQFDKKAKIIFSSQNLEQFLNTHSSIFVQNYGVNSRSTLSLRGTAASQSQILWEGVPINSAATGIGDLSLYSTGIFDNIQVKYGNTSTLFGNGNIGGTLLLQAEQSKDPSFQAQLAYGSFENLHAIIKGNIPTPNGIFNLKFFGNKVKNNFTYNDASGNVSALSNAHKNELGGLLSYRHQIHFFSTKQPLQIEVHTWMQGTERAIPPALFESSSVKMLKEYSLRNVLNLQQSINHFGHIYSKTSFSTEKYIYNDSYAFVNQNYQLYTFYNEIGWTYSTPVPIHHWNHNIIVFVPLQSNELSNLQSDAKYQIFRKGLAANYLIKHEKNLLNFQMGMRKEFQDNRQLPLIYNISAHSGILHYQKPSFEVEIPIFVSIQNSYRIPTLNELYYFPGGNINLKPEYGINTEMGFQFHFKQTKADYFQLKLSTTYFSRNVKDWIYWLGVGVWTPYNIAEVYSRGWDYQLKLEQNLSIIKLYFNTDYTYTIATTESSYLPSQNVIGKQIPYTPRYVLRNNIGIQWHQLLLNLSYNYVGYRFTNLDESAYLKPYQLFGLQTRYAIPLGNQQLLSIQLILNNMMNTTYQTANQRPMPLRNYQLSLSYTW